MYQKTFFVLARKEVRAQIVVEIPFQHRTTTHIEWHELTFVKEVQTRDNS